MSYLTAKELRAQAWEKLAARDGKTGYGTYLLGLLRQFAVLFCIGMATIVACSCILAATGAFAGMERFAPLDEMTLKQSCICLGVITIVTIVLFAMIGFARWGHKAMAIALMRGGLQSSHATSGKGNVWRMTSLMLWQQTFVFLWALLLIVPGVRAFFSYAMAPYLLIDNPDWSPRKCIAESKRMMEGHRWRFFCLGFSFIWWYLLVGIVGQYCRGFVNWLLLPYIETAFAAFYEELLDNAQSAPQS